MSRYAGVFRLPAPGGQGWRERMRLYVFQLCCAAVVLLVPAFGVIYRAAMPGAYDPPWMRWGLAALAALLLALSAASAGFRRRLAAVQVGCTVLLLSYFGGLLYLNGFAPDYAVGFLAAVVVSALLLSLSVDRPAVLLAYIAVTAALVVGLLLVVPAPGVNWAAYLGCMLAATSSVYIAISARLQVQEALEEREAHLAEAQRAAGLGNWAWDARTGRTHWSDELFRIAGLPPGEGEPAFRRLIGRAHADDRAALEAFWAALAEGRTPASIVARLRHDDGRLRAVRFMGAAEHGRGGRLRRLHGACLDVTPEVDREAAMREAWLEAERMRTTAERMRAAAEAARDDAEAARAEAEEMARLKSAFLANMSHEIRTPLTAIIGFAQVLAEEALPGQRELIEPIEESGKRLLATLNSVLDLARMRSDGLVLEAEPVDVAEAAHRVAALLRPLAHAKGLGLSVHAAPGGPPAAADPSALDRVLTNLLSNAVKFTERGHVVLAVEAAENGVRVRVRDTGRGIAADFLPRLFEEFRQESSGHTRSHEGSGLGLAITKGLVDLMGGTIAVASTPGEGTEFTVTLPLAAPDADAPGADEPPARLVPPDERAGAPRDVPREADPAPTAAA